ncbi:tripartite tricarboxylate transporter substrate binding protein [Ramlibacter monticola]|uniref:Tripartite tricarboxylate transporter substrate binding protein n=1 Tax=Ramlibacter monticola TaxID=1926872 RepID=A0A936YU42_9BURK|nr:tripartite tricarboxylate transporter substrate binding protein [Ramlibacter monticola]MBL0390143.1 tripartite tricarboxylate transporter substrate binding protein [Ramlibacter monticola]
MKRRTLFTGALGWAALGSWAHAASGESYPQRHITLVVPFGTGNIADNQGRMIARHLEKVLGQAVVVENKPGAGGSIGTEFVARAPANGYVLLYGTHGTQAANTALYPASRINPSSDLRAVHSLFRQSTVIVTPANRPWRSVRELLEAARKEPGRLTYSSSGVGTQTHLAGAKFQDATKVSLTHVPYNSQASITDLLAGNVDLSFNYAETVVQHIESGKLRALAINGKTRMAVLPGVPTVGEEGYPGAAVEGWSGVFAPRGTPDAIVALLAREIGKATEAPEAKAAMARLGSYPMGLSDVAFQSFVESEVPRWRDIVKSAGAEGR